MAQDGLAADSHGDSPNYIPVCCHFIPANTTEQEFRTNKFIEQSKKVGASISDDLKAGTYKATIFALVFIFFYIFVRFRDWRYSLGTIIALLHDVFVMLAVFSFLQKRGTVSVRDRPAFHCGDPDRDRIFHE